SGRSLDDLRWVEMFLFVVGNEAFEIPYAERLAFLLQQASAFAVIFLRTDAAGHGGQYVFFANLGGGLHEFAGDNQLYEILHLHADGTRVGASRLGALETAHRFGAREFRVIAEVHFGEARGA